MNRENIPTNATQKGQRPYFSKGGGGGQFRFWLDTLLTCFWKPLPYSLDYLTRFRGFDYRFKSLIIQLDFLNNFPEWIILLNNLGSIEWIFLWMNNQDFVLNWIIFKPNSMKKWIFKTDCPPIGLEECKIKNCSWQNIFVKCTMFMKAI